LYLVERSIVSGETLYQKRTIVSGETLYQKRTIASGGTLYQKRISVSVGTPGRPRVTSDRENRALQRLVRRMPFASNPVLKQHWLPNRRLSTRTARNSLKSSELKSNQKRAIVSGGTLYQKRTFVFRETLYQKRIIVSGGTDLT
jgi:hypothetical protein